MNLQLCSDLFASHWPWNHFPKISSAYQLSPGLVYSLVGSPSLLVLLVWLSRILDVLALCQSSQKLEKTNVVLSLVGQSTTQHIHKAPEYQWDPSSSCMIASPSVSQSVQKWILVTSVHLNHTWGLFWSRFETPLGAMNGLSWSCLHAFCLNRLIVQPKHHWI